MSFHSILFKHPEDDLIGETSEMPAFFLDLNLDQIIDGITSGREEYNLKPFFYTSLHDAEAINYRQEVMQDLEDPAVFSHIKSFVEQMRAMRDGHARAVQLRYKYQKERWFLEAVDIYCESVTCFARELAETDLRSAGMLAFREYLASYVKSNPFISLARDTTKLKAALSAVKYNLLIKHNGFQVRSCDSNIDYTKDIENIFERFRHGAVKDYRAAFCDWPAMNHVEEKVLEFVAQLWSDSFLELETFCSKHADYLDDTIETFDREIHFYVSYLEYISRFKQQGLKFCYPIVSQTKTDIYAYDTFDLALAARLLREHSAVVCNDFYLRGNERIFVVTGPNQGGKTTFARTFGELHYLAAIGCPVPAREARLFLFDKLLTHFEREENAKNLRGALEGGLVRIRDILAQATPHSIIIMNESFSSTTVHDALFLSREVLETIGELDLLCVCVTFIDELSSLSHKTVSMVSSVARENPELRTYKIVRRPADGLAWALSIADKYRLTYDSMRERIKS